MRNTDAIAIVNVLCSLSDHEKYRNLVLPVLKFETIFELVQLLGDS